MCNATRVSRKSSAKAGKVTFVNYRKTGWVCLLGWVCLFISKKVNELFYEYNTEEKFVCLIYFTARSDSIPKLGKCWSQMYCWLFQRPKFEVYYFSRKKVRSNFYLSTIINVMLCYLVGILNVPDKIVFELEWVKFDQSPCETQNWWRQTHPAL